MSSVYEYWASGDGLWSITPKNKPLPEGPGFLEKLALLVGETDVVEFGCGTGRLAGVFNNQHYLGLDISPKAIEIARRDNPRHQFELTDQNLMYHIKAETLLAHTVLLHIPDEALQGTINRFDTGRVLVNEIMGRSWRRDGEPPVFNRDREDYVEAFRLDGFTLHSEAVWPYEHYPDVNMTMLEFRR